MVKRSKKMGRQKPWQLYEGPVNDRTSKYKRCSMKCMISNTSRIKHLDCMRWAELDKHPMKGRQANFICTLLQCSYRRPVKYESEVDEYQHALHLFAVSSPDEKDMIMNTLVTAVGKNMRYQIALDRFNAAIEMRKQSRKKVHNMSFPHMSCTMNAWKRNKDCAFVKNHPAFTRLAPSFQECWQQYACPCLKVKGVEKAASDRIIADLKATYASMPDLNASPREGLISAIDDDIASAQSEADAAGLLVPPVPPVVPPLLRRYEMFKVSTNKIIVEASTAEEAIAKGDAHILADGTYPIPASPDKVLIESVREIPDPDVCAHCNKEITKEQHAGINSVIVSNSGKHYHKECVEARLE